MAELLKKINKHKRRDIERFHKSHFHDGKVSGLEEMKWTAEAMELMSDTPLTNKEKKKLVIYLYGELASQQENGFKAHFNIGGMIELVWDTYNKQYGLKIPKKSWLSRCMPCIGGCSCVYDSHNNELHVETDTPTAPDMLEFESVKSVEEKKEIENNNSNNTVLSRDDDTNVVVNLTDVETDGPVNIHLNVNNDDEKTTVL